MLSHVPESMKVKMGAGGAPSGGEAVVSVAAQAAATGRVDLERKVAAVTAPALERKVAAVTAPAPRAAAMRTEAARCGADAK